MRDSVEDTRFLNSCTHYRRITGETAKRLIRAAYRAKVTLYRGTERDYHIVQGVPVSLLEQLDPQGETAPCTWQR